MSVNHLLQLPRRKIKDVADAHQEQRQKQLEEHKAQDKKLLIASRTFAVEKRALSWWHLISTLLALVAVPRQWFWAR